MVAGAVECNQNRVHTSDGPRNGVGDDLLADKRIFTRDFESDVDLVTDGVIVNRLVLVRKPSTAVGLHKPGA
ncbi:hypothetical protein SZ54_5005 [Rhizobium sp. UR51a]|nr:hypothetical protein SZ54_5005 [Rhizobium sp. UR51a]